MSPAGMNAGLDPRRPSRSNLQFRQIHSNFAVTPRPKRMLEVAISKAISLGMESGINSYKRSHVVKLIPPRVSPWEGGQSRVRGNDSRITQVNFHFVRLY